MNFCISGLKVVLIHKQKLYPAVPVAYSQEIIRKYENHTRENQLPRIPMESI